MFTNASFSMLFLLMRFLMVDFLLISVNAFTTINNKWQKLMVHQHHREHTTNNLDGGHKITDFVGSRTNGGRGDVSDRRRSSSKTRLFFLKDERTSYSVTKKDLPSTTSITSTASSSTNSGIDSNSNNADGDNYDGLKKDLLALIEPTDRGRTITDKEQSDIEHFIEINFEDNYKYTEPTRSPLTAGRWVVEYTTAPPPSNGQLGPFRGIAKQSIDIPTKSYQNILVVPPNDWLMATLDASWEEWDGQLIDDDEEKSISKWTGGKKKKAVGSNSNNDSDNGDGDEKLIIDYGATCWRVTFESLTISLFGIPIFTKEFTKKTQRIWRTTYLDDDTRIVRAGRTGQADDEILFYMTRE